MPSRPGPHGGAQLPGDAVARKAAPDSRKIEPTLADNHEIGEVSLPQRVGCGGSVMERIGDRDDDKGRAGHQVMGLWKPVDERSI